MRFVGAVASLALLAGVASADDKVLVLKAEGRADKKVRAKIEARVLELAKTAGDPTAGDITYGDAAAMVGCMPEEDRCKAEVLGMLSVDEIVTITTTPRPGGIEISVRRIGKGGVTKTATAMVTADKVDQLDSITPLFGRDGPPSPLPPPLPASTSTPPPGSYPGREPPAPPPATTQPPPATTVPPAVAEPAPVMPPMEQPREVPAEDGRLPRNRRLPAIGMIGGAAMVVTGFIFWGAAAGVEQDIKDAPKRTRADLENLQDLEAKGDGYATAGNVLFIGGAILGGVSTYYFLKAGKRSSHSAQIVPAAHRGGGGIAIVGGF